MCVCIRIELRCRENGILYIDDRKVNDTATVEKTGGSLRKLNRITV